MHWKAYDPSWLVKLAQDARPAELWLAEALAKCTRAAGESPSYTYFVDPANANKPGAEWQFQRNIVLEHPVEGDLVFDILTGDRVGGVEFLSRL
jgi:hypothetical protein